MAGQIAELARDTLRHDFRAIDPRTARILLVEAADRVLTTFPPSLSAKAAALAREARRHRAHRAGRSPGSTRGRDDRRVRTTSAIAARTVVWAAGVTASSLASRLGELTGAELDRAGRVTVEPDLTLPGHPEVFALGDMVRVGDDGAPARRRAGRDAAGPLRGARRPRPAPRRETSRRSATATRATSPRSAAPPRSPTSRGSGSAASSPGSTWLVVHLFYLVGFQNRLLVFIRWSFSFVTHGRGARLITRTTSS